MSVFDIIGAGGVVCIVAAYALLQAGALGPRGLSYSALNAVGAGLVLLSLTQDFNLPAAMVEGFWLLISLWGFVRALSANRH